MQLVYNQIEFSGFSMSEDKRLKFLVDNVVSLCQIEETEKIRSFQLAAEKSRDISNFLDDPRFVYNLYFSLSLFLLKLLFLALCA